MPELDKLNKLYAQLELIRMAEATARSILMDLYWLTGEEPPSQEPESVTVNPGDIDEVDSIQELWIPVIETIPFEHGDADEEQRGGPVGHVSPPPASSPTIDHGATQAAPIDSPATPPDSTPETPETPETPGRLLTVTRGSKPGMPVKGHGAPICDGCGQRTNSRYHREQCVDGPHLTPRATSAFGHMPLLTKPVVDTVVKEPPGREGIAASDLLTECKCPDDMPSRGTPPGSIHHRLCPLHRHRWIIGNTPVDGHWPSQCNCGATKDHPVEPVFSTATTKKASDSSP